MEKIFAYLGHDFSFSLKLNSRIERSPEGRREHYLTVSNLGSANYVHYYTLDARKELAPQIERAERNAKEWVDGRSALTKTEQELIALGFSRK